METIRILVVDDEPDLCEILLYNLRAAGYEARAAHSADEALRLQPQRFSLLLLDVMMPGMSGFELAARLKDNPETAHVPIIFLTAKDTEDDTLQGFRLGADDYVSKPFSVREVMARVAAVLNRTRPAAAEATADVSYEGLQLQTAQKTISFDGTTVALTKTEIKLLYLLLTHPGRVFSRQELLSTVWPQGVVVTDRTVDVNVARLRKKLGPYAACLVSRPGYGYCFSRGGETLNIKQ